MIFTYSYHKNKENVGKHTVDGRNPAPREMYKTLCIMGFLPYQLVQDSLHQFCIPTTKLKETITLSRLQVDV